MGKPVVKNYIDPVTGELVIGGTLTAKEGATVNGLVDVTLLVPAGTELGCVKAAAKGAGDTVEAKIDEDSKKLFVPTYPVVPAADNQAISTAIDHAALLIDFNALLLKLKTAGLMTDDT